MKRAVWRAVALCLVVGALFECTAHAVSVDAVLDPDLDGGQGLVRQESDQGAQRSCEDDDCLCCYCSHVVTVGPVVVAAPPVVAILTGESSPGFFAKAPGGLFRPPRV